MVVVPDSERIVVLDKKDVGKDSDLKGWYAISPGQWQRLNQDLIDSDSNLGECLCLLRGESPDACDPTAPGSSPATPP